MSVKVYALPNFCLVFLHIFMDPVKADALQWIEYHILFSLCELTFMCPSLQFFGIESIIVTGFLAVKKVIILVSFLRVSCLQCFFGLFKGVGSFSDRLHI